MNYIQLMNINMKLLLLSILIGIIIIYIINPQPQVIFKYPNEKNIYIDENNVCYKYQKKYIN
jgi:hypothetical protein